MSRTTFDESGKIIIPLWLEAQFNGGYIMPTDKDIGYYKTLTDAEIREVEEFMATPIKPQ